MIAIASLLVIVVVGLLITRVATAALAATGLSREMARFQARSAFTGAGFTTSEAESVVNHPVRRRIVMALMLAGNAGIATVVAGLLLGLGGADRGSGLAVRVGVLAAGLFAIFTLSRSRWVDRHLRRAIGAVLRRTTDLEVRDYAELLHVAGDYVVDEMLVEETDWMCGRTLGELQLRDEGVVVLGIDRAGNYLGTPAGDTWLEGGDTLLLYGRRDTVRDLDLRSRGPEGDRAHRQRQEEQMAASQREQARLKEDDEDDDGDERMADDRDDPDDPGRR